MSEGPDWFRRKFLDSFWEIALGRMPPEDRACIERVYGNHFWLRRPR